MDMKNLVKVAMLVVAFASACCAQESVVNVSSKGKQKWSPSELDKVYLSACSELGSSHGQRLKGHEVTVWQSVTVLTLRRTSFASTPLSRQGRIS